MGERRGGIYLEWGTYIGRGGDTYLGWGEGTYFGWGRGYLGQVMPWMVRLLQFAAGGLSCSVLSLYLKFVNHFANGIWKHLMQVAIVELLSWVSISTLTRAHKLYLYLLENGDQYF